MRRLGKMVVRGGMMLALLLLCAQALPVSAGTGIGIGPAYINFDSAMRGGVYEATLGILNSGDETTNYSVYASGEAASWLSMSYKDGPFSSIKVPSGGRESFQVKVTVPGDAANRKYTAIAIVTSIPSEVPEGVTGQALAVSASSAISITVTGTQVISGQVNGITTNDVEVGYPLVIRAFFDNTGNVQVAPVFKTDITQNGAIVDSFTSNNMSAPAGQGSFVNANWDTTGKTPGNYGAHVDVNLDGKDIAAQDLTFKILPRGTLTRSGQLNGIVVEGSPTVGVISRVRANFANTGQIDTQAKFTGEVYLNSNLVQVIESENLLVEKGTEAGLLAYFKPDKAGSYTIKGHVTFEDKQSAIKEITVNVVAGQAGPASSKSSTSNSLNLLYPVGGGVAILIFAAVVLFAVKKSRRKA